LAENGFSVALTAVAAIDNVSAALIARAIFLLVSVIGRSFLELKVVPNSVNQVLPNSIVENSLIMKTFYLNAGLSMLPDFLLE
jgi:hypothetical protein